MMFAIKYRKVDYGDGRPPETLAIDIENQNEARALVDRLAASYRQNGLHLPPIRWFRNEEGLHHIWAQPQ